MDSHDLAVILTGTITAFASTASAALAAWAVVRAGQARTKATETHDLVNSRMSELLELTRTSSRAEGVIEGQAEVMNGAR